MVFIRGFGNDSALQPFTIVLVIARSEATRQSLPLLLYDLHSDHQHRERLPHFVRNDKH